MKALGILPEVVFEKLGMDLFVQALLQVHIAAQSHFRQLDDALAAAFVLLHFLTNGSVVEIRATLHVGVPSSLGLVGSTGMPTKADWDFRLWWLLPLPLVGRHVFCRGCCSAVASLSLSLDE